MFFYMNVGGPCVVEAESAEAARVYMADRLGYTNKPWLMRDVEIRSATEHEVDTYEALGGKVPKAPKWKDRTKR